MRDKMRRDRPKGQGHGGKPQGHGHPQGQSHGQARPHGHGKPRWKGLRGPQVPGGRRDDEQHEAAPAIPRLAEDDGIARIYGFHAVAAALKNPARKLQKLWLTENAEKRLEDVLKGLAVSTQRVLPKDLDRRLGEDTVHQGVLLEAEPLPEPTLAELAEKAAGTGPLVVLDQVTDPHNVGAIMRSAAVFGAAGLVMTRRHSPPLTGALAKAASGALEHVPVALVPNLARALTDLADLGLQRIGLDGEAEKLIDDEQLTGATAIVLGAEGRGLRRLTRESCDVLVRIGAAGAIASLNVSNATAIALNVASFQRRRAMR